MLNRGWHFISAYPTDNCAAKFFFKNFFPFGEFNEERRVVGNQAPAAVAFSLNFFTALIMRGITSLISPTIP